MILNILFCFCFLVFQNTNVDLTIPVKSKNFEGYIFDKNHDVFKSISKQSGRFTPTKEDIILAEKILKNQIKKANSDRYNQYQKCPVIHRKLKKYIRQYVGFINKNEEKIIWVNCIWKNDRLDFDLSNEIISVLDGCSYYWNIEINLTKQEINNLIVNGAS